MTIKDLWKHIIIGISKNNTKIQNSRTQSVDCSAIRKKINNQYSGKTQALGNIYYTRIFHKNKAWQINDNQT